MSLPPLPEPGYSHYGYGLVPVLGFSPTQTHAYGQACWNAAIEAAAKVCDGTRFPSGNGTYSEAFNEGCHDCIMELKGLTK